MAGRRQPVRSRPAASRQGRVRSVSRKWWACVAVVVLLAVLTIIGAAFAYKRIGRTPGELMDYTERRLQGHNKLEAVALPVLGLLREWLNEPSVTARRRVPLVVPQPPDPASLAVLAVLPNADGPTQKILRVGPNESLLSIASAAKVARDGDIVEIQAGTYRGDVTVWNQKKLTIRAVGGRARLIADGHSAEGKAIWVLRDGDFDIVNIDFIGARVPDKNGAGIRFEGGMLRVSHCLFWGNENGILTTSKGTSLEVHHSEFGYNGAGDGQSHHLYAGRLPRVQVTGNYFHHANVGHLLKSRAEVNEVSYNRFTDESGGHASYELDFPNGGIAYVVGNVIQQSRETENSVMIAFGAEGALHARNRLIVASNTLINDQPYGGTFVRASPGIEEALLANNLLVGRGGIQIPIAYESLNNPRADWEVFAQAVRHDYRLNADGRHFVFQGLATPVDAGVPLVPTSEYVHPLRVRRLAGPPAFAGAVQAID